MQQIYKRTPMPKCGFSKLLSLVGTVLHIMSSCFNFSGLRQCWKLFLNLWSRRRLKPNCNLVINCTPLLLYLYFNCIPYLCLLSKECFISYIKALNVYQCGFIWKLGIWFLLLLLLLLLSWRFKFHSWRSL